jgi:branched-chain amino acid transport system permease protein
MLVFGFAMVAIMVWRPRGLVATRDPSVYLGERKAIGGNPVREGKG